METTSSDQQPLELDSFMDRVLYLNNNHVLIDTNATPQQINDALSKLNIHMASMRRADPPFTTFRDAYTYLVEAEDVLWNKITNKDPDSLLREQYIRIAAVCILAAAESVY